MSTFLKNIVIVVFIAPLFVALIMSMIIVYKDIPKLINLLGKEIKFLSPIMFVILCCEIYKYTQSGLSDETIISCILVVCDMLDILLIFAYRHWRNGIKWEEKFELALWMQIQYTPLFTIGLLIFIMLRV